VSWAVHWRHPFTKLAGSAGVITWRSAAGPVPEQDAPLLARLAELGVREHPKQGSAAQVGELRDGAVSGDAHIRGAGPMRKLGSWRICISAAACDKGYLTRAIIVRNGLGRPSTGSALLFLSRGRREMAAAGPDGLPADVPGRIAAPPDS
jgi:hypothetical protein